MGHVVLLSFTASLNPTLLTATTVMLLLPSPGRLMLGYWLGAMMVSITLGLLIVFSLDGSKTISTTKNTLSPAADIVLGALALVLALVLGTGRDQGLTERRARRREGEEPPRWQRTLSRGSAKTTFVVGVLLTLPGASYLLGLHEINKLNYSTAATVLVIVGFNLVMLILLEAPLVAFGVAPQWAPQAVERAKTWVAQHARHFAVSGFSAIGGLLIIKGAVGFL